MAALRMLVLTRDAGIRSRLEVMAASMPWAESRALSFEAIGAGDMQELVAQKRERVGALPLGVVAEDAPAVLAALSGGADEAEALGECSPAELAAFLDRVELRASLRAQSKRLEEMFAHAERLTALGALVAGVAHEINNPLTSMHLCIEVARRSAFPALELADLLSRLQRVGAPLPHGVAEHLLRIEMLSDEQGVSGWIADMQASAEAIARIARDLRVFGRSDHEEVPELVTAPEIIDQAVRLAERGLGRNGILERDDAPDLPPLVVPKNRVIQVLINILVNASHALREVDRPGRVRISARADDEFVAIAISDNGPGIPPALLARVFDPFFTTKRAEMGTGLGLSISRAILRRLGGELSVESVHGEGATFLCFLPIPTAEALEVARRRRNVVVGGRSTTVAAGTVLIVEEDRRVLRSYARVLRPAYNVLVAEDGREAIELLESGSCPDMLLCELDLPEVDGPALLSWVKVNRPALHACSLVVTAAADQPEFEPFLSEYPGQVLHKPVNGDELLTALSTLGPQADVPPRSR